MRNDKGFTLIELILVIGIAAILATVSIRSIASRAPGQQLNGAAQALRSDLNRAKALALRDRRQYQVTVSGDSYTLSIGDRSVGSSIWTATSTNKTIHPGITLSGGPFTFDPRGTASSTGDMVLTNSSGTRSLTVTLAGRVRSS